MSRVFKRKRYGRDEHYIVGDFGPLWAQPISKDQYDRIREQEREQEEMSKRSTEEAHKQMREAMGNDCPE